MTAFSRCCGWICTGLALAAAGCASGPYEYGRGWHGDATPVCAAKPNYPVEVQYGQPNNVIDGAGWIIGIQPKLFLWDRRASNHDVSPETTAAVVSYLQRNGMEDVLVRVNQYDPVGEWERLRENDDVAAGWRYTAGTLTWLQYTLWPGRLSGRDKYNPFTNSVYIYSDIPSLGIQSAAYAKDVHQREFRGPYAAVNQLPVVSLWHETIATEDSLLYYAATGTPQEQDDGRRILYPHYGMCVGGAFDTVVGFGPIFEFAGAMAGHTVNRYQAPSSANPPMSPQPPVPPNAPAEPPVADQPTTTVTPVGG